MQTHAQTDVNRKSWIDTRIRLGIFMKERKFDQKLVIGVTFMALCAGAFAETVVYKWIDEDGVVHFGDAPPDESSAVESLVIPKAPPAPASAQPTASAAPAAAKAGDANDSARREAATPLLFEKTDISKMSIAELNLRCDEAREGMISPLREAEIAKCKQNKRDDPERCERFNADFGEGGRTASGSFRPRMFADLPECLEAEEELNRRPR